MGNQGSSAKNLKGLTSEHRWKKGQSGNPKGRPKLPDLKGAMAKLLATEGSKEGLNALEAILKTLFARALKGDTKAAEMLLNRGYGLPKQELEHTGEIQITFTRE